MLRYDDKMVIQRSTECTQKKEEKKKKKKKKKMYETGLGGKGRDGKERMKHTSYLTVRSP